MGSFQEAGTHPGQVLPAPLTVASTAGMVLGPNGWVYPPGYLLARDNGGAGTPLNTTGETSVLNSTLAGALPAFVSLGDAVQLRAWGIIVLNTSGTHTLNVYAGATKIASSGASGAITATRGWFLDLWIHLLSATAVEVTGMLSPRTSTSAGFNTPTDFFIPGSDAGVSVTVSTLPLAIDIKSIMSVAATTSQVSCKGAEARYFPKNY